MRVRSSNGFTLMEMMVALAIFLLVSAMMASSAVSLARFNSSSEKISAAIAAAQLTLDELRLQDPTSLPTSGSTEETVEVNDKEFDVVTSYCTVTEYCASANNRHLLVEVYYRGEEIYTVETVYTRLR